MKPTAATCGSCWPCWSDECTCLGKTSKQRPSSPTARSGSGIRCTASSWMSPASGSWKKDGGRRTDDHVSPRSHCRAATPACWSWPASSPSSLPAPYCASQEHGDHANGARLLAQRRIEGRVAVEPRDHRILRLGRPAARLHAARRQPVDVVLVTLVVHGGVELLLAEPLALAVEDRPALVLDVALVLGLGADLVAALRLVLDHLVRVLTLHGEALGRAGAGQQCRSQEKHRPHLAP